MSIIFSPDVIYWAVTGLSLQTAWSWLMLVALSLLAPLVSVETLVPVVVTPLPSSPVQAGAGPHLVTRLSLLGGSQQTLSQPRRLRSLARPLEVLVLDPEGLRHVLSTESVSALPVILPPHPQSLDAAHLPGLGQAPTCCASQVKDRRRVRSEVDSMIACLLFSRCCKMIDECWPVCFRSEGPCVHVRVSHHCLLHSRPVRETL